MTDLREPGDDGPEPPEPGHPHAPVRLALVPGKNQPPTIAGLVPVHNIEAEESTISACLSDPTEVIPVVLQILSGPEDFYSEAYQLIFTALRALFLDGRPVDYVTVYAWLRTEGLHVRIGPIGNLRHLVDACPAVPNVEEHAQLVADDAAQRRATRLLQELIPKGYRRERDYVGRVVSSVQGLAHGLQRSAIELAPEEELWTPQPPVPWLVKELEIVPGPPTLVAGYGYSGKTVVCQALALAVATGYPAWGRFKALRSGPVMHLDYEQGKRLTNERYQRLMRAERLTRDHVAGRLRRAFMPRIYLDGPKAELELERLLGGVALCIVDSLRAAAPSIEENSSDARRPLDMLTRISEHTGCAFVVIHHARKPSGDAEVDPRVSIRGSGAIFDACASVFVMRARKGEPTFVSHEKARNTGTPQADFCIEIRDLSEEVIDDETGTVSRDERWGLEVVATNAETVRAQKTERERLDLRTQVLEYVRKHPRCSTREIVDGVRGRKESKQSMILQLHRDGSLHPLGSGTGLSADWVIAHEN